MTTISVRWDAGLGRYRDPYAWELSPALRGGLTGREAPGQYARDVRRAARDARTRSRRARQEQTR